MSEMTSSAPICQFKMRRIYIYLLVFQYFCFSVAHTTSVHANDFGSDRSSFVLVDKFNFAEISPDSSCDGFCFTAARGESEFALFKFKLGVGGTAFNSISLRLDELPKMNQNIVEVSKISQLSGIDHSTLARFGPYDDVVEKIDIKGVHNVDDLTLYMLSVQIPRQFSPGSYAGKINFFNDDSLIQSVNVNLNVTDLLLPKENQVKTHLFGLDIQSLKYWYEVTKLDPLYYDLVEQYLGLLKAFRLTHAPFPDIQRPSFAVIDADRLPVFKGNRSGGSSSLHFRANQELELSAPRYEVIKNGFSVHVNTRFMSETVGKFLSYRWFNRVSGFDLSRRNGKLTLMFGERTGKGPVEARELQVDAGPLNQWQTVKISLNGNVIKLQVNDGDEAEFVLNGQLSIAYGGVFKVNPEQGALDLGAINWQLDEAAFKSNRWDFSPDQYDIKIANKDLPIFSNEEWLEEVVSDRPEFVNSAAAQLANNLENIPEHIQKRLIEYASSNGHLKMPHDEAIAGTKGDSNVAWSVQLKEMFPDIRVLHSFGSLNGRKLNGEQKKAVLERFVEHVDIVSIRTRYLDQYSSVLNKAADDKGIELSPYIHEVDKVEVLNRLAIARSFFWKLYANDLSSVSYWNTNLWFQPDKTGRPERRISRVSNGFEVSKRNPAGIASGMLVYPGVSGPTPSLRLYALRDGIEDFEYLKKLEHLSKTDAEAKILLDSIVENFSGKGRWFKTTLAEQSAILNFRDSISELVH